MENSKVLYDCSWWEIQTKEPFFFPLWILLRKCLSCSLHFLLCFYSYLLFFVTVANTAWCVELHGNGKSHCSVDMFIVLKLLWQSTLDYPCNLLWCSWLDMFMVCILLFQELCSDSMLIWVSVLWDYCFVNAKDVHDLIIKNCVIS